MIIKLPLLAICTATRYDSSKLPVVDTYDDDPSAAAYYEERGWDKYHPINHRRTMMPEFGPARYFYGVRSPVAEIAGRRFKITVESDYRYEPYDSDGKFLVLEETDEPESIPNRSRPDFGWRGGHNVQLFGQPHWIQGESYPSDLDGDCCRNLITIENEWGDLGNWNILVGLNDEGFPNIAYFEAACH